MVGEMVWFDRHPDTYLKRFTSTRVPQRGSGGRVVDVKRWRGGRAGEVQRGRDGRVEEVRRGRRGELVQRLNDGRMAELEMFKWGKDVISLRS